MQDYVSTLCTPSFKWSRQHWWPNGSSPVDLSNLLAAPDWFSARRDSTRNVTRMHKSSASMIQTGPLQESSVQHACTRYNQYTESKPQVTQFLQLLYTKEL